MLDAAWLALRQAQEALKNGRLEEAERVLHLPAVRDHRRTGELLARLAQGFAERGERSLRLDDAEGAWRDLLQAERLGLAPRPCEKLRQTLTGLGMSELRASLSAGQTARAEECVTILRQRGVRSPELQVLEDGLKNWLLALELGGRGEFSPAREALDRARRVLPANIPLQACEGTLEQRQASFPDLLSKLLGAAHAGRWRETVETADQVLALAPQHAEARSLRARAWKALEPGAATTTTLVAEQPSPTPGTGAEGNQPGGVISSRLECEHAPRFFLWIDGVGGYLLCLGSRLTFGQATLETPRVDVPLVADVSRLHASLSRDGEGYLLEAIRPVQVNGQPTTRTALQAGDRITLGSSCQFLFRLPVSSSATARLDLVSGHRLPQAVDGVLLLAQALVLGSGGNAHVLVPDMKESVVLFRHRDGLGLRSAGELRVNGELVKGRTILPPQATVTGDDFGFALEAF